MIQPTSLGLRAYHQPDKPALPPRDSISPLLKFPVLVNQCVAKDRCLTLFGISSLAGCPSLRIWLQPRFAAPTAKTQELSKNEYVFTLPIFRVKKISTSLSCLFSIECSSSTCPCRNLVQRTFHSARESMDLPRISQSLIWSGALR